jgi:hypothetical protein
MDGYVVYILMGIRMDTFVDNGYIYILIDMWMDLFMDMLLAIQMGMRMDTWMIMRMER